MFDDKQLKLIEEICRDIRDFRLRYNSQFASDTMKDFYLGQIAELEKMLLNLFRDNT